MMTDLAENQLDAQNELVYALAAPQNNGPYFSACTNGLYRSNDRGQTWTNAYKSIGAAQSSATMAVASSPDFEHDQTVYAGVQGGILRSTDGGHTWRSAVFPAPAPTVVAIAISPGFSVDNTLYVGTAEDGVLVSSDGGSSWTAWNFGLLDMNILCLTISPGFTQDETLFAGTTTGLFVSTNGGRAWREVDLPADFPAVLSLAISPDFTSSGRVFVGTEEHGIFRTRGQFHFKSNWEHLDALFMDPVNAILLDLGTSGSVEMLVLHGSELFHSSDGGTTFHPWTRSTLPEGYEITAIAAPTGFTADAPVLVGGIGGKSILI